MYREPPIPGRLGDSAHPPNRLQEWVDEYSLGDLGGHLIGVDALKPCGINGPADVVVSFAAGHYAIRITECGDQGGVDFRIRPTIDAPSIDVVSQNHRSAGDPRKRDRVRSLLRRGEVDTSNTSAVDRYGLDRGIEIVAGVSGANRVCAIRQSGE